MNESTPVPPNARDVGAILQDRRKELLDLSSANRLLNFRIDAPQGAIRFTGKSVSELEAVLKNEGGVVFVPVPAPKVGEAERFGFKDAPSAREWAPVLGMSTHFDLDQNAPPYNGIDNLEVLRDKIVSLAHEKHLPRSGAKLLEEAGFDTEKCERLARAGGFTSFEAFVQTLRKNPKKALWRPQAPDFRPSQIPILFYSKDLELRLRRFYATARSSLEETGVGILHIIIGFLEWQETAGGKTFYAPLSTVPVEIERNTKGVSRIEYVVRPTGDESLPNITLSERLRRDFGFLLPQREDGESLEHYFTRVEEALKKAELPWRVRRFASLGLLSFSKMMMFEDLKLESWPDGQESFTSNPVVSNLFSLAHAAAPELASNEAEIDVRDDLFYRTPLVELADSSQQSVLIDALDKGRNLIVEGPPGTGKSQTITNLIAGALFQGKRVLFVAEKKAALDVVKRRLDRVGLGPFCLELHGDGANKRRVLEDLRKRLLIEKAPLRRSYEKLEEEYARQIAAYKEARDALNRYAAFINTPWKGCGKTPHEIFAAKVHYEGKLPKAFSDVVLVDAASDAFDELRAKALLSEAEYLKESYTDLLRDAKVESLREHPWYGASNVELRTHKMQDEVLALLSRWEEREEKFRVNFEGFLEAYELNREEAGKDPARLLTATAQLPPLKSGVDFALAYSWLKDKHLEKAHGYVGRLEELQVLRRELKGKVAETALWDFVREKTEVLPELRILGPLADKSAVTLASLEDLVIELESMLSSVVVLSREWENFKKVAPQAIAERLVLSESGIDFLAPLLDLATALPDTLIAERAPLFDEPATELVLERLEQDLADLADDEQKLGDVFRLDVPLSISQTEEAFSTVQGANWLTSLLSGKVKEARKALSHLAASPDTSAEQLMALAEDYVQYRKKCEALEEKTEYQALGKLFVGRKTSMEQLRALRNWYRAVRQHFGVGFGTNVAAGDALFSMEARALRGLQVSTPLWQTKMQAIQAHLTSFRTRFPAFYELISEDWMDPKKGLEARKKTLSEELAAMRAVFETTMTVAEVEKQAKRLEDFRQRLKAVIEEGKSLGVADPKAEFLESQDYSIVANLRQTVQFAGAVSRAVEGSVLKDSVYALTSDEAYRTLLLLAQSLLKVEKLALEARSDFFKSIGSDAQHWMRGATKNTSLEFSQRNREALEQPEALKKWGAFLFDQSNSETTPLAPLSRILFDGSITADSFIDLVRFAYYSALSQSILKEHPEIASHSKASAKRLQDALKEADRKLSEVARELIAVKLRGIEVPLGTTGSRVSDLSEKKLIEHEINKKTRFIPIRELIRRSTEALLALKPCWMMSPLSVAQYLAPGKITFDLVVMDEASQIRPSDALGAILRAKQVVVVGDSNQLPPTNFFQRSEVDLQEQSSEDASLLADNQSILEAMGEWLQKRTLRWHYRSRHESLIEFSNRNFYDNDLIVFPSPERNSAALGLKRTYIEEGVYTDGVNRKEAEVIAEAVLEHALKHPEESLAVVTMNAKQQQLIDDLIEAKKRSSQENFTALEALEHLPDGLIVKNLENIQGDERDVVFISTTYGPEEPKGKVPQRFGPINQTLGWRRLNVLFTRSRMRTHVFTSLQSTDIRPMDTSSSFKSLSALRGFLERAENAGTDSVSASNNVSPSLFEQNVLKRLEAEGFKGVLRVGCSGYFIDIGILDEKNPEKYLLAIEGDGAMYAQAQTAKDRDYLRPRVLEHLKWKIHRIWSTDWYADPQGTLRPILEDLETYKEA